MRLLDKNNLALGEDWYGNTAAVTCFGCGKVFLTSQVLHRKGRACPACGKCRVLVKSSEAQVSGPEDL